MTNEEFLRDVCPNHTDKSQWNQSELLHILELYKEQLRLSIVSQQRELFYNFITWYNAKPNKNKEKMIYTDTIEEYLKL